MPRGHDRLADALPREQLDHRLRELHGRVAAHAAAMRSHADMIAQYCRPPLARQAS
jgi:hypothetical protein